MSREGFRETARLQRCCAVCGTMGAWQAHHVVSRQQLKKAGEGWREWDERNALRLCVVPVSEGSNCHYQHENAVRRVRVSELTQENIDFAFEALGDFAFDYLQRYYRCDDESLERELIPRLREIQRATA